MSKSTLPPDYFEANQCTCKIPKKRNVDHWKDAVERVKQEMFSSTSVGIPSPTTFLKYLNNNDNDDDSPPPASCRFHQSNFEFNSDPFGASDPFIYRRQRSDHLFCRLTHWLGLTKLKVLRIDHGVYVVQNTEPVHYGGVNSVNGSGRLSSSSSSSPTPSSSPKRKQFERMQSFLLDTANLDPPNSATSTNAVSSTSTSTTSSSSLSSNSKDLLSIFTFDQNDIPALISNDHLHTTSTTMTNTASPLPPSSPLSLPPSFVPYSYTLGARYTNPGSGRMDMMLRGRIPLWCQTLLLFELYTAQPPVQPNQVRYGLIPFAPDVPLSFISLIDKKDHVEEPELLLWYERIAMDASDHELYGREEQLSVEFEQFRTDVLESSILCQIDDETAETITASGHAWTRQNGVIIE